MVILYIRGRYIALARVELLLSRIRARRDRTLLDRALSVQTVLLLALSAITMAAPFVLSTRETRRLSRPLSRVRHLASSRVDPAPPASFVVAPRGKSLDSRTSSTVRTFIVVVSSVSFRPFPYPWVKLPMELLNETFFVRPTWRFFASLALALR